MGFLKEMMFFLALLNPFLLSLYMLELFVRLERRLFIAVLSRGFVIAGLVFSLFAVTGDRIFTDMLQVKLASFQVFGGLVFLVVGLRMFFDGAGAISAIRGEPEHLAGSIAMPFLVGPATVSAAILIGSGLPLGQALSTIWLTLVCAIAGLFVLKEVHDRVRARHARLIDRYVEVTGRISALVIGTYAVEMVGTGIRGWLGTV